MADAATLILSTFVPALAASAALTPLARRLALKANLVAAVRPDRLHREVRPYGGGLAIALTLALAFIVLAMMPAVQPSEDAPPGYKTWTQVAVPMAVRLGLGAMLFFVIGLIDDRWALRARPKLALQFLAAAIVVIGFDLKGAEWLAFPGAPEAASILWIVLVVNAVNLFDHADGLAGAMGLVALVALATGQMLVGQAVVPGVALVVAGALAGFLIYNFPPAKLFLGDTGSSLLGYLLAAIMLQARYYWPDYGTTTWVVLVPVAILAVPLFDMACAIGSRLVRRESPFIGDATSHLAHRMLARGWRPRAVVLFVAAVTAMAGAGSVAIYHADGPMLIAAWGTVAAALVAVWLARRPAEGGTPAMIPPHPAFGHPLPPGGRGMSLFLPQSPQEGRGMNITLPLSPQAGRGLG